MVEGRSINQGGGGSSPHAGPPLTYGYGYGYLHRLWRRHVGTVPPRPRNSQGTCTHRFFLGTDGRIRREGSEGRSHPRARERGKANPGSIRPRERNDVSCRKERDAVPLPSTPWRKVVPPSSANPIFPRPPQRPWCGSNPKAPIASVIPTLSSPPPGPLPPASWNERRWKQTRVRSIASDPATCRSPRERPSGPTE